MSASTYAPGWKLNFHHLNVNERNDFLRITHHGKMMISSVADLGKIANPLSKVVEKWPFAMNPHSTISYLLLSGEQIDDLCHAIQIQIQEELPKSTEVVE